MQRFGGVDGVSRSDLRKADQNVFCLLGLNRKKTRAFNIQTQNYGLAEEGFNKVWSNVCRTTAVFFVLSCW